MRKVLEPFFFYTLIVHYAPLSMTKSFNLIPQLGDKKRNEVICLQLLNWWQNVAFS